MMRIISLLLLKVYFNYAKWTSQSVIKYFPTKVNFLKVNNRNLRKSFEICTNLPIKNVQSSYFFIRLYCSVRVQELKSHRTKKKFLFKNFFSKCDQIRSFLRIWSYLLKKSLIEDFFMQCQRFSELQKSWNQRKVLRVGKE